MIETDALVVGAGPVGLWTVFELGLQGIAAQVVDVLGHPGGQCAELYPDKPIYDIPALPACSGQQLIAQLLQQIAPFAPDFHFDQQVSALQRQPDGRWQVSTARQRRAHQTFLTRTLFIAAGVGAFVPREPKLDGLADFEGRQLFYRADPPERFAGKAVVLIGGEEAAVAAAIALAGPGPLQAASVTLVHRRDVLQADESALARLAELRRAGQIRFVAGQLTGLERAGLPPHDRLMGVRLSTPEDETLTLGLDHLLVCQGISPKLGPLTQWGLAMERKLLSVDTATFATSEPGIFAVGDIVTYPGKKKLIVCGFHEATLAAFAAAALLHPGQTAPLQYTTSSALLQQRLGVAS